MIQVTSNTNCPVGYLECGILTIGPYAPQDAKSQVSALGRHTPQMQ